MLYRHPREAGSRQDRSVAGTYSEPRSQRQCGGRRAATEAGRQADLCRHPESQAGRGRSVLQVQRERQAGRRQRRCEAGRSVPRTGMAGERNQQQEAGRCTQAERQEAPSGRTQCGVADSRYGRHPENPVAGVEECRQEEPSRFLRGAEVAW